MNCYVRDKEENEYYPVELISVSDETLYFVAKDSSYTVYRTEKKDSENIYGTAVTGSVNYESEDGYPVYFSRVEWFEQFGFAKIIFACWDSFDEHVARLYFDIKLYEQKKKELHGI